LPSVTARAFAFVGIIIAGLAGALIGFSLIDLQCDGNCDLPNSIGLVTGAVVSAIGMSIVVVLVLRALGEWRELEDQK
jgi:xanthine/uracil permease